MSNITRTIYANALQSAKELGIPYVVEDNTTLNEKFGIQSGVPIPEDTAPLMKYVSIGRNGHRNVTGADGAALTSIRRHLPNDAACYQHIPFVLREINDDITAVEREKYGLRRYETHHNVDYIAYYLRRLDHDGLSTELNRVTITDGNVNTVPYIPSSSDLSPVPVEISPTEITELNGEYLTASTPVTINFSQYEVNEIINACEIIYGDRLYAVISEVALCTGVDLVTNAQNGDNPPFNYTEAVGVQVNTHICTHHPVHELNNGLILSYNLGGSEALTQPYQGSQ
jgi:hypothetical protein